MPRVKIKRNAYEVGDVVRLRPAAARTGLMPKTGTTVLDYTTGQQIPAKPVWRDAWALQMIDKDDPNALFIITKHRPSITRQYNQGVYIVTRLDENRQPKPGYWDTFDAWDTILEPEVKPVLDQEYAIDFGDGETIEFYSN